MTVLTGSRHVLYLVLIIISILSFAAWFAQQRIAAGMRDDIGASLQTVLDTTHQAIHTWVKQEQASARIWANSSTVSQYAKQLLETAHTPEALIPAPAQAGLRKLLQPVKTTKKYQGYFILSTDGISLASSRDENIGTQNLLVSQQAFIQKILAGETALSLPQRSDVPLLNKEGRPVKARPTMFVGAPILDDDHNVMAIFVFRLDPFEDFAAIFQRGRIGETGETYAFNRMGQMISNSRFETRLRSLGLLQSEQRSMLNIMLRVPVKRLRRGRKTNVVRSAQALTLMANQAIAGKSGRNLEGYRDYRGVPVVGAWLWDNELNIGITTEIDANEAYATLTLVQYIVFTLTALAILLLSLLAFYFLNNRKRILESEERLRRIVNESPCPITITDPQGNIEHFNRKFIELFGWTTDDARTQEEWWRIACPDEKYRKKVRNAWEWAIKKALSSGTEIEPQQWKLTCKNGDVRDVEFRMMPTREDYNVIAMQDLTERLKAEEEKEKLQRQLMQAQKMEAIGQMTGGIAHDFNNMLASIHGFTELAKEAALSNEYAKVPEYLDEVLDSSQRASGLVAKMLAYSRSNGTKNGLKPQALQTVIHDSLSMLKSILPSSIVFNTGIGEDLPDVLADAVQLQQVIINLCVNARDAMQGKGQIDICLCLAQMESATCHSCLADFDGSNIELSVADNGGGISPEILDRMFDPFFTTKEVGKGSGMGLSMVHGIVHDHNGHIVVESRAGEGTRFRLFFSCDD